MHPRRLTLTPEQQGELARGRDHDARPYLRERAAAALKVAAGQTAHRVARHGLHRPRDPDTLYAWLDAYERAGLAGLVQRPRRRRGFPPPQGEELVRLVRQEPARHGLARARWRLADLRAALPWLAGYTLSGVGKALRRLRVRLKRGRLRRHSPDPADAAKVAKRARARARARAHPTRVALVYGDACGVDRQPTRAPLYAPVGEEPAATLSHRATARHRVCGGLDAATGRVVRVTGAKVGVDKLKRFLRALRAAYPDRYLLLAWDNWPVHGHDEVLAEARAQRVRILWLPTSAPETNPIEKLWRWLQQERLHQHRRADDRDGLRGEVLAFLDRFAHGSDDLLRYVGLLPT